MEDGGVDDHCRLLLLLLVVVDGECGDGERRCWHDA